VDIAVFDAAVACELAGQPEVAVGRSEKLEDLLSATAAKLTPSRNARGFPHPDSTTGSRQNLENVNIAENGFAAELDRRYRRQFSGMEFKSSRRRSPWYFEAVFRI
jgi:hypothetical protein